MVWGALGALIFSVYLVYDTQVKSVNVMYLVCLMIMRFLPTLRFCRPFIILGEPSIVSIIFPDDDWWGPQVLDLP